MYTVKVSEVKIRRFRNSKLIKISNVYTRDFSVYKLKFSTLKFSYSEFEFLNKLFLSFLYLSTWKFYFTISDFSTHEDF
jgi:hypothetical protein